MRIAQSRRAISFQRVGEMDHQGTTWVVGLMKKTKMMRKAAIVDVGPALAITMICQVSLGKGALGEHECHFWTHRIVVTSQTERLTRES